MVSLKMSHKNKQPLGKLWPAYVTHSPLDGSPASLSSHFLVSSFLLPWMRLPSKGQAFASGSIF